MSRDRISHAHTLRQDRCSVHIPAMTGNSGAIETPATARRSLPPPPERHLAAPDILAGCDRHRSPRRFGADHDGCDRPCRGAGQIRQAARRAARTAVHPGSQTARGDVGGDLPLAATAGDRDGVRTHDQGEALTTSDRIAVTREGRIEQIDNYERPATRFVARFIGTANLISEPQGAVVIRPERSKLRAPGGEPSGVRCWPATVERVVYSGSAPRAPAPADDKQLLAEARPRVPPGSCLGYTRTMTKVRAAVTERPGRIRVHELLTTEARGPRAWRTEEWCPMPKASGRNCNISTNALYAGVHR